MENLSYDTRFEELVKDVVEWGTARNLIRGSVPVYQGFKTISEWGELVDAVTKKDIDGIIDGIGDVLVTLIIREEQINLLSEHEVKFISYFDFEDDVKDIYKNFTIDELLKNANHDLASYLVDSIGPNDFLYQLLQIASHFNLNVVDCLQSAYNEIKDRKGVLYNGMFIKESDSRYPGVLEELGLSVDSNSL